MTEDTSPKFRPRARLLQLLGDQLIGHRRLAVFELVKNAYDADASHVEIRFVDIDGSAPKIIVRDNGEGMDEDRILRVWLEPGADFREQQRKHRKRSTKFNRLPLGEKGVGRFAVHKLGTKIELRTRSKNEPEYRVEIDWEDFGQHKYMDEAKIEIAESADPVFVEGQTGTQIVISGLREQWKRGDVRRLWRNVKSISSPSKAASGFQVELSAEDHDEWVEGLLDIPDFIDQAMWHFIFSYANGQFEWSYEFEPLAGIKVEGRELKSETDTSLKLAPQDQRKFATIDASGVPKRRIIAGSGFTRIDPDSTETEQLGTVMGEFFAFDRDKEVLEFTPQSKDLTDFLDKNGGVRVYRDGVRVYNYGERASGDDWLGLDQRRVNIPTRRVSNNIIIGSIDLSLEDSGDSDIGLVEKTNREGFVENSAFDKFKAIVLAALIEFENLRQKDKQRIKDVLKSPSEKAVGDLDEPIRALSNELEKRNLSSELGGHLKAIEQKFNQMKEVMTHSGNAGLNLGVLFHEIDRGVKGLTNDIKRKASNEHLLGRAEHLSQLLDGFSTLLRKDRKKIHSSASILKEVRLLNENRFEAHNIVFSCPPLAGESAEFQLNVSFGMVLGAISNLIDNAIYWLQVRWPDQDEGRRRRAIYLGTTDYFEEGPAIVIADNGPGLPSDTSDLIKPFVTLKPDGMGLGLYYANLVCELNNARLVLAPERSDLGIPAAYDGAAIAMVFPEVR